MKDELKKDCTTCEFGGRVEDGAVCCGCHYGKPVAALMEQDTFPCKGWGVSFWAYVAYQQQCEDEVYERRKYYAMMKGRKPPKKTAFPCIGCEDYGEYCKRCRFVSKYGVAKFMGELREEARGAIRRKPPMKSKFPCIGCKDYGENCKRCKSISKYDAAKFLRELYEETRSVNNSPDRREAPTGRQGVGVCGTIWRNS